MTLKMKVKGIMHNIRSGTIRWRVHDFLSDGNSNVALSLTICKIFTELIKCQKFDLENEGQGEEKWYLCHFTRNVRFNIGALGLVVTIVCANFIIKH